MAPKINIKNSARDNCPKLGTHWSIPYRPFGNLRREDYAKTDDGGWHNLQYAKRFFNKLFHLGAGAGDLREFCRRYEPSIFALVADAWPSALNESTIEKLANGIDESCTTEAAEKRDTLIAAILRAKMQNER